MYQSGLGNPNLAKSQLTSSSIFNIDKFKQEYEKANDTTKKKEVLANYVTRNMKDKDFEQIFFVVADVKFQAPFRSDLVAYFIDQSELKCPDVCIRNFSTSFLAAIIRKDENFDRIGIISKFIMNSKYADQSSKKELKKMILEKMKSLNENDDLRFYKLEEVEAFLNAKRKNNARDNKILEENDLDLLKFQIKILYYGIIEPLSDMDIFDKTFMILIRWILILAPLADSEEYHLLYDITNTLTQNGKISQTKIRKLLFEILEIFKLKFSPGDQFQGYRNLVVALNMIPRNYLQDCVENELNELIFDQPVLFQVLYNMVNANITENTCAFIFSLAQNYQINGLYTKLIGIFKIIWQNLLPKIRVKRCFGINMKVCEFFFFGLVKIQKLNENIIGILLANLKFLSLEAYRNSPSSKENLSYYLKFLSIIANVYDNQASERESFKNLNQIICEIRKEFNIHLSENELQKLITSACEMAWNIPVEDASDDNKLSMSDTILMKYEADDRYRGIKNIGNTCYMASTMQALFRCENFKTAILDVLSSSMKNPKIASGEGWQSKQTSILSATQKLFTGLTEKNARDAYDPSNFKETLPQRFSASKNEQDASEFLFTYFELMENYLKLYDSEKDLIKTNFTGEQICYLHCSKCNTKYKQVESISNLYLSFNEKNKRDDQIQMIKRNYEREEFLNEIDCENCKTKSQSMTKDLEITNLPPTLIITFNRFDNTQNKIFDFVQIYEDLDLNDILKDKIKVEKANYRLNAIVVHVGKSTITGHYYTIIRDYDDQNLWISLNDSRAYTLGKVEISEVFKKYDNDTPYILFYQKVNSK